MAPVPIPDDLKAAIWPLVLPLLASLQIGTLITWGLQGVLFVQTYNYYIGFGKDPWHMKLLVYLTLVIEMIQTIMATHDTYGIFVEGFGNWQNLDDIHLLWCTLSILGGLAGLLCHMTFAYRISLVSESRLVGCAIAASSLFACACSFGFGGMLHHAGRLSTAVKVKNIYLLCGLWNGVGAFTDCSIAILLSYYLTRNNTKFRDTEVLITRIIRMTIETGAATATASIASAILFIGFRDKLTVCVYFVIPSIMISKLYAITIMATFNNRPHVVGVGRISPQIQDSETCLRESISKRGSRMMYSQRLREIQIGTSVVTEIWPDDAPSDRMQVG
ncbi:hypothetical protein CPB83DRAFT_821748 [Crepidotus variabilis]|uniref:DUF6534 domain-containing protein n=1 Tax=Crepidotus variabilis TaxID=179855 RepID=A0A9P6JJV2_9AGAR|nr:hypothetical protein CPB83DRAFT_821748 [Crepidotus variabilis]